MIYVKLYSQAVQIPKEEYIVESCSYNSRLDSKSIDLPQASEKTKEKALKQWNDLIDEIGRYNQNQRCWYYPITEAQPAMSKIVDALEIEARLSELSDLQTDITVALCVQDKYIISFLLDTFHTNDDIKVLHTFSSKLFYMIESLKELPRRVINSLMWVYEQMRRLRTVKPGSLGQSLPRQCHSLVITRFEQHLDLPNEENLCWCDLYLGGLPQDAWDKTKSVVLLGRTGDNAEDVSVKASGYKIFPVRCMEQLLTTKDIFKIIIKSFLMKLVTSGNTPVSRLAMSEGRSHVRAIADCMLVEVALDNFMKICIPDQIICMQENSVWEHAVSIVAEEKSIRVTGIFHCPVMPSALRYHTTINEMKNRPIFKNIIPLGSAMSHALNRLGPWHDFLLAGYAFRHGDIHKAFLAKTNNSSGEIPNIVILLGGMYDNAKFLRWVINASNKLSSHNILIKGHPVYGASQFIKSSGIQSDSLNKIEDCSSKSLLEVLAYADIVVYKGTTACLFALAAGIPVIHVDHGGLLSDDTLFDAEGLCMSVNSYSKYISAVNNYLAYSPKEKTAWASKARNYVRSYYDISKESLSSTNDYLFGDASLVTR